MIIELQLMEEPQEEVVGWSLRVMLEMREGVNALPKSNRSKRCCEFC